MNIVSSIMPKEAIMEKMKKTFPEANFYFFKGIEQAREHLHDCEVFITYGGDLTEEDVESANKLKWIMVMSAGVDKMPLEACRNKGILITNARGIHKIPMAEYTLGMMLQYEKKMKTLWENEKDENWERRIGAGELCGKTVLILGTGAIGGEIARLAKAFRMATIGVNRSGRKAEFFDEIYKVDRLGECVQAADYVISVLPSTKETYHLLTYEHFEKMKKTAVFVNIGRGDVVPENVLIKALENSEIAHAILDVFEMEPLPEGHPFWKMENATVTPHVSSLTKKYLPRAFEIFEENLHIYMADGKNFVNEIDYNKGY